MNIAAVVAEYNPFHLGHEYMLNEVRAAGADGIIAVMSGNFVQRGDCAVADKRARTKAALLCGVDLVLELPLIYAAAGAQRFAGGAAEIIRACGCVDTIVFGSECGDAELIARTAKLVGSDILGERLRPYLDSGMTFAAARQKALCDIDKAASELLGGANDTLAVEYLAALNGSGIKPTAVKRKGANHDGDAADGVCSASKIRQMLLSGDIESAFGYMPYAAADILRKEIDNGHAPATLSRVEIAMLSSLRQMSAEQLALLPDISEGLENRFYNAVREGDSIDSIAAAVKSKRYTLARIRRILLAAYLGISERICNGGVPYIRVLGANETGRKILGIMKKSASLPIVTKAKDLSALDKRAFDVFSLECRATDLYWLMTPKKLPCGKEMTDKIIMI